MIRGRTGADGSLDWYEDSDPDTVVGAVTKDGITGAAGGAVTSADITDATTTGRAVLTAASQAAARTAIGAGTSSTTGTVTSVNGQTPTSGAVTVGANTITTGVLPIAQVPTGATATTVALGNHTHTISQVTDLTAAKLMTNSATAVNATTATDAAGLVTFINTTLLPALRARGIVTGS